LKPCEQQQYICDVTRLDLTYEELKLLGMIIKPAGIWV